MPEETQKLEQVIKYILNLLPSSAGKTELVKYVYLSDHKARQILGRPISEVRYFWHHFGPWSKQFDAALAHLRKNELIEEDTYPIRDWIGYLYRDAPKAASNDLSPAERRIIKYIVKKYKSMPLHSLLEDVVYQTSPMQSVLKNGAKGQQLPMSSVDNEIKDKVGGLDLEEMLEGEDEIQRGETITLDELVIDLPSQAGG